MNRKQQEVLAEVLLEFVRRAAGTNATEAEMAVLPAVAQVLVSIPAHTGSVR